MEHTEINPWEWSKAVGFSQAVKLTGAEQLLVCSGQTAIGSDGSAPTTSDMGDQVRLALDNVVRVLEAAGMTPADIVKTTLFTTDVDELIGVIGTESQPSSVPIFRRARSSE